jgi:hypothetical protein
LYSVNQAGIRFEPSSAAAAGAVIGMDAVRGGHEAAARKRASKRKSPACEMSACSFEGAETTPQKTRPPAEYDALAALPCPDIEIGSRHPVIR